MNFVRQIERIQRVDQFISKQSTGSPEELASKLDISRRQLFRLIEELKDYGAPIEYSRSLRTFYYLDKNFRLKINFSIQFITEKEERKINGGNKNIFLPCQNMALYAFSLASAI